MIALDTNILVHAHRREANLHSEAAACVRSLAEDPAPWAVCFHSFVEFYGIVSHQTIWDVPSTPEEASDQIAAWRESPSLRILTDTPDALQSLMELTCRARIRGARIHDARIANCCLAHGIRELWTVDRDFSRFTGLRTRNPLVS